MKKIYNLSIVIPVYNDEEVLLELNTRISKVAPSLADSYELVLIDDGSKDKSWEEICKLKQINENIVAVKLVRNFGQQNAIAAGLHVAKGDVIVLMDSDLQDRPEDIHLLLDALDKSNASMAIAQWVSREDSFFKKFVSNLFYQVSDKITNIHIQPKLGCFRAMRREVVDELRNFPEKTATTLSLLYFIGSNYVCVPLKRDARFAGTSGYNIRKMLSLTFARIFSFSLFPIRLATYIGLFITLLSFILGIIFIIKYFVTDVAHGWTSVIVLILFLFGLNFAFLGIIGEYLGKIFLETKQRPKFIIEVIK